MPHYHFWVLQTTSIGRLAYVQDPVPYEQRATCNRRGKASGQEFMVLACSRLCWANRTTYGLS